MHDLFDRKQRAAGLEILKDDRRGLFVIHIRVLARILGRHALAVDRNDDRDIVLLADDKVVRTKAGRSMDAAGTGIQRDMVAADDNALAVHDRMLGTHQLKVGAHQRAEHFPGIDLGRLHNRLDQFLGEHIDIARRHLDQIVFKYRIDRDRKVARQSPGGRGPDHKVYVIQAAGDRGDLAALVIGHVELDIDGRTRLILVFDLRLGKRSLIMRAPVDRLHALVDIALLGHLAENLDLGGLIVVGQRQIRAVPVADDTQALKLSALGVDMLMRKFLALGAELRGGNLAAIHAVSLDRLTLDRQAVSIPAGDIRRLIAKHVARTQNEVLKDLIERMAHVQIAVGIRRAVMQNEERLALVLLHQLMIKVVFFPALQKTRLALGQAGTHGKISFWQIDRIVIILLHCAVFSPFEVALLYILGVVFRPKF